MPRATASYRWAGGEGDGPRDGDVAHPSETLVAPRGARTTRGTRPGRLRSRPTEPVSCARGDPPSDRGWSASRRAGFGGRSRPGELDPPKPAGPARELFSLDHPLEQFYAQVRRERVLRGTERRFRGLRLPRDASVYEALLHAIVGQQLSVRAANTIQRRLFERVGSYLDAGGVAVPCVPTPSRLRALSVEELRSVGMSRAKAASLRSLAAWAADRPPTTHALSTLPLPDAVDALDRLPGVGRWTAENALLRGAGRPDVFVAGDLGVRVALEEYGVIARTRPEAEARAWAERNYPGWGSYATLYLWRKLTADHAAESG